MADASTAPAVVSQDALEDPRVVLLLAIADDELVIGHRHSHWTGVAPHLEEDLALSSISQDEIGHAVLWYSLAAPLVGCDADALGLGRDRGQYRHAVLVERGVRDWAYTIARHYLYDTAEDIRLRALARSSWTAVAEATGAILREERYHLLHAREWLARLARGPVDARRKLADGLTDAFAEALALFEPLPGEDTLLADGTLAEPHTEQLQHWLDVVATDLRAVGLERVLETGTSVPDAEMVATSSGALLTESQLVLPVPTTTGVAPAPLSAPHLERDGQRWVPAGEFRGQGGRHGHHTPDFDEVWEEMTGTYRAHPGARW